MENSPALQEFLSATDRIKLVDCLSAESAYFRVVEKMVSDREPDAHRAVAINGVFFVGRCRGEWHSPRAVPRLAHRR